MENAVSWITGIVTVFSVVAAITPTPKDNDMLSKFYQFIDLLALNVGKAKDK